MTKTIYTKWLAVRLIEAGFPAIKVDINPTNPKLLCWEFEDTEAFRIAFTQYSSKKA